MLQREAEKRRRVRHKAEQDQQAAEAAREKAAERAYKDEVVVALHRLHEQGERTHDQQKTERDRRWSWKEIFEISGLWFAGIVGAVAIAYGVHDAKLQRQVMEKQLLAMNSQLNEMSRQAGIAEIQLRPKLRLALDAGGLTSNGLRFVTPVWRNAGVTEPVELTGCVKSRMVPPDTMAIMGPDKFNLRNGCPDQHKLTITPDGAYQQSSVGFSEEDVGSMETKRATGMMWGNIAYRDPFKPEVMHRFYFCKVVTVINDNGVRRVGFPTYSPDCNNSD